MMLQLALAHPRHRLPLDLKCITLHKGEFFEVGGGHILACKKQGVKFVFMEDLVLIWVDINSLLCNIQ
jgi:hypothetical protein